MYAFTTYIAVWLQDILVDISNGNRPSVTGLSDFTWTSAVQWVKNKDLHLGCIKSTRYTALAPMIRVWEIIKVEFWDVDMLLAASFLIPFWKWTVPLSFFLRETTVLWKLFLCRLFKEKQLCCKNSYRVIYLKRNNCVVKTLFIMC